jgi:drug/metabolite transporter (DMT)-like permease
MVFCAAVSGSLGSVMLGRLESTAPATVQTAWGALLGGVILHAASTVFGEPAGAVEWTPSLLGLLLYLSVIVGGVGYVAFLILLRTIGPTRTSFTAYVSPVVAILLGWLLLHEPPTATVAIGLLSIMLGFLLLNGIGSHDSGPN